MVIKRINVKIRNMFDKLFAKRKKRRISLLLILIPFIVLSGVFGYFGYKSIAGLINTEETPDNYYIESMNYKLRNNATEYQIELFSQLTDAIENGSDDLTIAELVAKNFIADYFTWTNKAGSYDVGGVYYMYSPYHTNFISQNRDNFYKYVSYYKKTYGSESLIEVTDIQTISADEPDEMYETQDGALYRAFKFECEWTYENNRFDGKTDFMTSAYIKVIANDDGRFEIVSFFGAD